MPPDYDMGRAASMALTSVRTVLSHAETALHYWADQQPMEVQPGKYIGHRHEPRDGYDPQTGYLGRETITPHPELAEMRAALEEVVEKLDRWRRTGRPKKPAAQQQQSASREGE
jgi:hypothetical protein